MPSIISPPATLLASEPVDAKVVAAALVAATLAATKALPTPLLVATKGVLAPVVAPLATPRAGDDIDALNARVDKIMAAIADKSIGVDNPMAGNTEAILAVQRGAVVYHRRSQPMLVGAVAIALAAFATAPSAAYAAACLMAMWVCVDFYGAVLHVVLDTPSFVEYPLIGPGCLEFQWHHAIPNDIVSKPFYEVCGDLNLVALLHLVWLLTINGGAGNHAANVCGASKLLMAYVGQWAHRMAHSPDTHRPAWVRAAQGAGLLVSPALHKAHHTAYDDAFPILSGLTAPLVAAMLRAVPSRHAWLALFVVMSLADVYCVEKALTAAFAAFA